MSLRIIRLRAMIHSLTSRISLFVVSVRLIIFLILWQHVSRSESFAGRKTDYDVNFTNVYKSPETMCVPQFYNEYDQRWRLKVGSYMGTFKVFLGVLWHVCELVYVCVRWLSKMKWLRRLLMQNICFPSFSASLRCEIYTRSSTTSVPRASTRRTNGAKFTIWCEMFWGNDDFETLNASLLVFTSFSLDKKK